MTMKNIIVGTAGHIDHGKSALIEALTGTHPDRLEEEKRRGITLDLGFAFLDLGETRIGFVDVPGHEHFVSNMLAGASGFDLVLLAIAADNSIQPQTREHFDICRLLGIERGIVALTKIDLVDADTLGLVRLEVADFLRGSFLESAPVVPVSAKSGAGMDTLRLELVRVAAQVPEKSSTRYFRLPIDRAFVMKGFGTVVTGTLVSGDVRPEDEVELFPSRRRVRIRGVQSRGLPVERAAAGQRTALNLAGVDLQEVSRGMVLASPGRFEVTSQIDARISMLQTAPRLKHRARVHFHQGTTQTIAQIYMLENAAIASGDSASGDSASRDSVRAHSMRAHAMTGDSMPDDLAPGDSASRDSASGDSAPRDSAPGYSMLVQLRLAQPVLVLPGDRFILRRFSPVVTIGGGIVLDAGAARHKSSERAAALDLLRVLERGVLAGASPGDRSEQAAMNSANNTHRTSVADRAAIAAAKENASQNTGPDARHDALAAVVSTASAGMTMENLVARTGWLEAEIRTAAQALAAAGRLRIASEQPFVLASVQALEACACRIVAEVDKFHRASPLMAGISRENLRERTAAAIRPELFRTAVNDLALAGKLELAGDLLKRAGRAIDLQPAEVAAKAQIEREFAAAGLSAPAVGQVLAKLAVEPRRAEKLLQLLLREKVLVRISRELVFHKEAVMQLRGRLEEFKRTRGATLPVGEFKTLAGISRKYAIPLLEYFDREHVTRREGDARVIL